MNKTKLAKAITLALAGAGLSLVVISDASASHTKYNTYQPLTTDGWTKTGGSAFTGADVPWLGTAGNALPFGYTGKQAQNWAAMIDKAGDSLEISQADAQTRYGTDPLMPTAGVDLDVGGGAWYDHNKSGLGAPQGWAHNTDYGLFMAMEDTLVSITGFAADPADNLAFTVFKGMDTGTDYSHHSAWNVNYLTSDTELANNPHFTTGLEYLTHTDGGNAVEFLAEAGQKYSIYMGGNAAVNVFAGIQPYTLNINTSPVPVPGAVWLMGSGIIGLMGYGRKRQK